MKGKSIFALAISFLVIISIASAGLFSDFAGSLTGGAIKLPWLGKSLPQQQGLQNIVPQDDSQRDDAQNGQAAQQRDDVSQPDDIRACRTDANCPDGKCVCKCIAAEEETEQLANGEQCSRNAPERCQSGFCKQVRVCAAQRAPPPLGLNLPSGMITLRLPTAGGGDLTPQLRAKGADCSSNSQCQTGYCDLLSKKCDDRPAQQDTGQDPAAQDSGQDAEKKSAGEVCSSNAQCESNLCETKYQCSACTLSAQCGAGKVCRDGVCEEAPAATGTGENIQACSSNADCASGYCRPARSATTGLTTRQCAPCTLNTQCGTGKVCVMPRPGEGACLPLQATGGVCNENSDCSSNNCAGMVTVGSARVGRCAAASTAGQGAQTTPQTQTITPTGIALRGLTGRVAVPSGGLKLKLPSTGSGGAPQLRAKGDACSSDSQCQSGYCDLLSKKCDDRPAWQDTGQGAAGQDSGQDTTGQDTGQDTGIPAEKKSAGEECSGFAACGTECESGIFECACEAEQEKKPEGAACADDEECESGECDKGIFSFAARTGTCAAAEEEIIVEPEKEEGLSEEAREKLESIQPKLESIEAKAVEQGFASRAELEAMSPGCFEEKEDLEEKQECLTKRFEALTNVLKNKGVITASRVLQLRQKAKGIAVREDVRREEPEKEPEERKTFFGRVKGLFGLTGKAVSDAGQGRTETEQEPSVLGTDYSGTIATMDTELNAIQNRLCSRLSVSASMVENLEDCMADDECSGDIPMKCDSTIKKCIADRAGICPAGEFSGAEAADADEDENDE